MATIAGTLRATAGRVPDREALIFGETRYTYAELDAEVDRVAGVLADHGLRRGDRLALMATNSDRFVITFYACHRLGAILVPVNPASAVPELEYLLHDSGATVVVFDPAVEAVVRTAAEAGVLGSRQIFATARVEGFADLFALAADRDAIPVEVGVGESDDAQILYTSGTTGAPKGALFDHHRALWDAFSCSATCGMADGDRFLHVAPLYHAAELCIMLIPGTMIGATHVVHSGFDPAKVLDTLEKERITMFFGVPTMYQFLLRQPDLAERDLSAWRTGMFGAAPMPPSAVEQLTTILPKVNFLQMCGQTEAGPSGIFSNRDQVRERPDASGRQAMIMTECRVVDADGNEVAPGEVGELLLRGETLMKGYWNKPEATADTIRDGWLHTGDLVRLDPDGYMTLVDRLKDMIITGGRNVYSVEVEHAIAAHPAVLDCAAISRPHLEYGESIVAVVVMRDGVTLTLDELREFCRERISSYKLPHDLVITDSIDRNPSGKILKHRLRRRLDQTTS
ncbi:class I adenylate-forming enzyme family protein [Dietzia sp. KRD202]|uniref:class I adenylate-forming enzyme family protein n=1 Tax=Dietzia sp. KRD202 TaxID=2729732 RepID=UPI0019CFC86E|nr:long-chain-fatty-acid--CoA ligase [Dietzia sp. KRD202]